MAKLLWGGIPHATLLLTIGLCPCAAAALGNSLRCTAKDGREKLECRVAAFEGQALDSRSNDELLGLLATMGESQTRIAQELRRRSSA